MSIGSVIRRTFDLYVGHAGALLPVAAITVAIVVTVRAIMFAGHAAGSARGLQPQCSPPS